MGKWNETADEGRKALDRMLRNLECEYLETKRNNARLLGVLREREERIHRLEAQISKLNLQLDVILRKCSEAGIEPRSLRL